MNEIKSALEAILFAAGDSVPRTRLSLVLEVGEEVIDAAVRELSDEYSYNNRGMRILCMDDKVQMCSAPEYAGKISRILEQRKPPMLSQAALETLAITAYFQPVTRAYIEQIRGVDSSYTVGMLTERGLIEECGKLDVPGRPVLFRTTDVFLRTMGVSSLSELPPLPDVTESEGMEKLQNSIAKLRNTGDAEINEQISLSELTDEADGE